MSQNPYSNVPNESWYSKFKQNAKVAQNAILNEDNILLLSPTGSGKTLAFYCPVFQLLEEDVKGVQCLILVPSRELGFTN